MKWGLIDEGMATLGMKQDMQSENKNMYDLIAYRIKVTPIHVRVTTGVYIQVMIMLTAFWILLKTSHIHYARLNLRFVVLHIYYWLLAALGLYQPYVWKYSRLNISNTVMSKRKLNRLVTEKWVDGWDDPRLMTLAGLRRRGVSATSINAFI
ncbi:glutamine--tRNA ligase-like [Phoenix dactylifera]|uniref:Glutamine--tRNA ligase-like n=1 Tax=Phoenix dactylifera TaxID=42345 RepID=A0A8B9APD3_PHODC|nr:glutamine--tRNA ligase-like [Phoenix dactylifera]